MPLGSWKYNHWPYWYLKHPIAFKIFAFFCCLPPLYLLRDELTKTDEESLATRGKLLLPTRCHANDMQETRQHGMEIHLHHPGSPVPCHVHPSHLLSPDARVSEMAGLAR